MEKKGSTPRGFIYLGRELHKTPQLMVLHSGMTQVRGSTTKVCAGAQSSWSLISGFWPLPTSGRVRVDFLSRKLTQGSEGVHSYLVVSRGASVRLDVFQVRIDLVEAAVSRESSGARQLLDRRLTIQGIRKGTTKDRGLLSDMALERSTIDRH